MQPGYCLSWPAPKAANTTTVIVIKGLKKALRQKLTKIDAVYLGVPEQPWLRRMSHHVSSDSPQDLTTIIARHISDPTRAAALLDEISSRDATKMPVPHIIPNRRYRITEIAQFGYHRSQFYKRHRHLIRKDHRLSYVLGSDLLAEIDNAPRLAAPPPRSGGAS